MYWLTILEPIPTPAISDDYDLSELMTAYEKLLYSIAIGILGKSYREDAEECVADAFLGYWRIRQKNSTTPIDNVKAYLAVSVKHLALNRLEKLKKQRYEELTEDVPDVFAASPEEMVMAGENRVIIREVLEGLPAVDREIWLRRYFWCQAVKEIARQMELKPKYVENRLYTCKKTVREQLTNRHINL